MRRANAEQGLIPPHLCSLVSRDQLCSLHPTNLAARFALCLGDADVLPGRQLRSAASVRGAGPAQEISHPFPPPRKLVSPSPHVLAQPDGGKGAVAQLAQSLVSRVEHLSFLHGVVASCGHHRQETLLTSLSAFRLTEQLRTAILPEERLDRSQWPPLAWEEPGTISALEPHARGPTCALGCRHLLLHPLLHGPAALQILARVTEAVGNRVVGHRCCDLQRITPLKRAGELQGSCTSAACHAH